MYKTLDYTVKNPLLEAAYNYIKLYKNITFQKNTIWEATEKIIKFDKMKRWDEQIVEHLDTIIKITDYWKNPFANDAGGSSICNDIYTVVTQIKKQINHNHLNIKIGQ